MKCSKCYKELTKVLESRLSNDGKSIRRRRICQSCQRRFTTYEREEHYSVQIKKRDGRLELFQREKALRSVQIACRKRNIKLAELEFLIGHLEVCLYEKGDKVISSRKLGDKIMSALYKLDKVAYVRFASVYKDFKDPKEFYALLRSLSKPKNTVPISTDLVEL